MLFPDLNVHLTNQKNISLSLVLGHTKLLQLHRTAVMYLLDRNDKHFSNAMDPHNEPYIGHIPASFEFLALDQHSAGMQLGQPHYVTIVWDNQVTHSFYLTQMNRTQQGIFSYVSFTSNQAHYIPTGKHNYISWWWCLTINWSYSKQI
jgi:hypothetical protein